MAMQTAFLFPGQGAQTPGFLHALPEHESVLATFRAAHEALPFYPVDMDSGAVLRSTAAVQLGILIAGVAYVRVLAAKGVFPDAVAGLSVGAFTAAVASGALDFEAALQLVRLRAQAMEEAYGQGGHGMMAILGMREPAVQQLVAEIARPIEPLYQASVNAPAEIIVAGSDAGLAAAAEAASRAGARARRLTVNVPSHCPLLDGVSMRLREAMREVRLDPPREPNVSNQRARALTNTADIAEDLILNVSRTVRRFVFVFLFFVF